MFLGYLRTLHLVCSLVRRWVTRRLTRLQTMYNGLKYRKTWWNDVKTQFTGNATQPQRNRKCQFNNDQYCILGTIVRQCNIAPWNASVFLNGVHIKDYGRIMVFWNIFFKKYVFIYITNLLFIYYLSIIKSPESFGGKTTEIMDTRNPIHLQYR